MRSAKEFQQQAECVKSHLCSQGRLAAIKYLCGLGYKTAEANRIVKKVARSIEPGQAK